MNGLEAARRPKTDARTRGIPIVMLTGTRLEAAHCDRDWDRYIEKPCAADELVAAVDALLHVSAARAKELDPARRPIAMSGLARLLSRAVDVACAAAIRCTYRVAMTRLRPTLKSNRTALLDDWKRRVLLDPSVPEANRPPEPALSRGVPALLDARISRLGQDPRLPNRPPSAGHRVDLARARGATARAGLLDRRRRS